MSYSVAKVVKKMLFVNLSTLRIKRKSALTDVESMRALRLRTERVSAQGTSWAAETNRWQVKAGLPTG